MRVLLVQDDGPTSRGIELALKAESMVVDCTDLGEDALEIAKLYNYDIILLDLALPDMHGAEVLRRLRQARVTPPVLILSGPSQLESKLQCLASGADDYLTKPFDRRELVARIQAIVRRSKGHAQSEIRTGKLSVNLAARTVSVDDQPLHLTGKEYGILELLSLRKGTALTKEMSTSTAARTNRDSRSSMYSSASCARSRRQPPAATPAYVRGPIVHTKGAGRRLRPPSAETGWFRLPCRSRRRRSECVSRSSAPPGSSAASRSVRRS